MSTRTTSKRELAAEIGSLLGDLAVRSKRSLRPLLEAEGVTMPQAMLLQALQRAGGRQSARELGRECHMLASTVTGVIDRLEAAGLVQRERDSRDRRIVWVVLTGDGEELVGPALVLRAPREGVHGAPRAGARADAGVAPPGAGCRRG